MRRRARKSLSSCVDHNGFRPICSCNPDIIQGLRGCSTCKPAPSNHVATSAADQVPAGFRFALKASQRITHKKRLKEAESETEYLLRVTGELGDKLGALLFQMPPYLHKDAPRLAA